MAGSADLPQDRRAGCSGCFSAPPAASRIDRRLERGPISREQPIAFTAGRWRGELPPGRQISFFEIMMGIEVRRTGKTLDSVVKTAA